MKKPKSQTGREQAEPSGQNDTPAENMSQDKGAEDAAAEASTPTGLKWLKYAGIGPPRLRQGKGNEGAGEADRPGKRKLSGTEITSLGSLEAELMGLLWELGQPATGMEVMEQSLYKRRAQGQEPVSFATVNTTLRRLSDKGVVETKKNVQGTPVYSPIVAREEMAARILNNVSVTLLGQSLHGLLPRLLGTLRPAGKGKAAATEEQDTVRRLMQALEETAAGEKMDVEKTEPVARDETAPEQGSSDPA